MQYLKYLKSKVALFAENRHRFKHSITHKTTQKWHITQYVNKITQITLSPRINTRLKCYPFSSRAFLSLDLTYARGNEMLFVIENAATTKFNAK